MILQTDRLILREMNEDDWQAICAILQDEKVMYAYEHAFSDQEVKAWLDKQQQNYKNDGFGLWAVVLKETDRMIGQCGMTWQQWHDQQVLEIGYLFQREFWHQGFATEAAIACKHYAFQELEAKTVYSIIRDNNWPSQRVAQRNGMTLRGQMVKHYYNIDMPHIIYGADNPDYD